MDVAFWPKSSVLFQPRPGEAAAQVFFDLLFALGLGHRVFIRDTDPDALTLGLTTAGLLGSRERVTFVNDWQEALKDCDFSHTVVSCRGDSLTGLAARISAPVLPSPDMPAEWRKPNAQNLNALRIAIIGPESTGKSTLAAWLAGKTGLCLASEYIRMLLDYRGTVDTSLEDVKLVSQAQAAYENAVLLGSPRGIICDGEPRQTLVWSDVLFRSRPEDVDIWAKARRYHAYLVCRPDIPWQSDPQRCLPNGGAMFYERLIQEINATGVPIIDVAGEGEARLTKAFSRVKALLT